MVVLSAKYSKVEILHGRGRDKDIYRERKRKTERYYETEREIHIKSDKIWIGADTGQVIMRAGTGTKWTGLDRKKTRENEGTEVKSRRA